MHVAIENIPTVVVKPVFSVIKQRHITAETTKRTRRQCQICFNRLDDPDSSGSEYLPGGDTSSSDEETGNSPTMLKKPVPVTPAPQKTPADSPKGKRARGECQICNKTVANLASHRWK